MATPCVRWQLLPVEMTQQSQLVLKRAQTQLDRQLLTKLGVRTLAYRPLGQPYVPQRPRMNVAISHSERLVLVAVAPQRIGVDVEHLRGLSVDRLTRAFTASEWRYLNRLTPERRQRVALKLWTAKEAVLKLVGCGLTRPPREVAVALPRCQRATFGGQTYRLTPLRLPQGYVGTGAQLANL